MHGKIFYKVSKCFPVTPRFQVWRICRSPTRYEMTADALDQGLTVIEYEIPL